MYTLTFTIYSLLFVIMLFNTILIKRRKKTVRSLLFILIIASGMLFALFEIVAITVFLNYSQNQLLLRINWNIRMIGIFFYIMLFILYYDVLINGEKYNTLRETIFKSKKNTFVFIMFTLLIIVYTIFNKFSIPTVNDVVYVSGFVGISMVILAFIVAFYLLFIAYKVRKERRNVYNCFVLIFFMIVICFPIQLAVSHISLMPFCTLYIVFVVYHNIEDPDIELLEEVTKLKSSVENSSDSKTDFLYNLSYDLINPINTIDSLVTNINSMDVIDRNVIIDNYKGIISASNIILDSVNNMVDYSINNGKSTLKEYSVYELVSKLKTLVISKLGKKNVAFDLNITDNVNAKYYGDIDKNQKVLSVLLNNSCKYTSIGKIKLEVSARDEVENHFVTFRVYDTGSGMSEEAQKVVFNGSELSECKNLVESMGGTIGFKSVFGGGSSFYITIAQKRIGNDKAINEVSSENDNQEIVFSDLSNYKVLLVDDSEMNNKVTSKLLSKYKLQITDITSSLDCVNRIKREEEYDIIFIDHKMKEMDGVEIVNLLRTLDGYKIPKIVCLTANVFSGARDYYLSKGFDEYLAKPIDIHDLDRVINKFIKGD